MNNFSTEKTFQSQMSDEDKQLQQKSKMLGTSVENMKKIISTYSNDIGPAAYSQTWHFGRPSTLSSTRNYNPITFRDRRMKDVLSPETKQIITTNLKTPGPGEYSPTSGYNPKFKNQTCCTKFNEKKFFVQKHMEIVRATVPIQYTGSNGIGPAEENLPNGQRSTFTSVGQYRGKF